MKFTRKMLVSLSLMAAVLLLLSSACTKKDADSPEAGIVISNTHYTAPTASGLPTRYNGVSGVALISISAELKEQLALLAEKTPLGSDRFFVLLNPKVPTEGILVRSPMPLDTAQNGFSNHQIAITGNVIAIEQPQSALVNCFTDKYGFTLASDAQGRPVYIDAESIDDPDAKPNAAAPNATAGAVGAPESSPSANPETIELIDQDHPLTSTATDNAASESNAASSESANMQSDFDAAASAASQPANIPVSQKKHSLNVTPAPRADSAPKAEPKAPEAPAPAANNQETAANIDAPTEAAAPQDIAPTAQPIHSLPVPQDIAPTSQPLE